MPENANRKSSVPWSSGNSLFQSYSRRIMLWPSRNAATENSIGIVGTSVATAFFSNTLRPLAKTSSTTDGSRIRGR